MSDALSVSTDDRLERIAVEIETIQGVALLKVGERLLEAQELFRHNRDEGGFEGWVEKRLTFSRRTAYRIVDVFKTFGSAKECQIGTLSRSVLYELAAPSNKAISEQALAQINSGQPLTNDDVAELKRKLKAAKDKAAELKIQFEVERTTTDEAREALRTSTNEGLFLKQSVEQSKQTINELRAEIERLKQEGVIHVYPANAPAEVDAPIKSATVEDVRSTARSLSAADIARIIFDNLHPETVDRIAIGLDGIHGTEIAAELHVLRSEEAV